jgi:hypothetical protein
MRRLATILCVLFLGACSPKESRCISDLDCFAGEVCTQGGVCGEPWSADAATADTRGSDAVVTDDAASRADAGNPVDAARADDVAAAADGGLDAADVGPTGPCVADPFEPCEDDEDADNNSFPGERVSNMTYGCQSDGFESLNTTISGRMCPLDPMDMYGFNIVECYEDEGGFVIEATLDVKGDCDPDTIHFDVGGVGATCADPGEKVQCETLADGRRRIQVLFPGETNPVVGGIRFSVETPDREDIEFDYDLELAVRQ